jgi:hypothetical protein
MKGGILDWLKPKEGPKRESVSPVLSVLPPPTKTGQMQIYDPSNYQNLFWVDIEYTENEKKDHKEIKIYKITNEDPRINQDYNTKPLVIKVNKHTGTDEIYELILTQESMPISIIRDTDNKRYFIKGIQ